MSSIDGLSTLEDGMVDRDGVGMVDRDGVADPVVTPTDDSVVHGAVVFIVGTVVGTADGTADGTTDDGTIDGTVESSGSRDDVLGETVSTTPNMNVYMGIKKTTHRDITGDITS